MCCLRRSRRWFGLFVSWGQSLCQQLACLCDCTVREGGKGVWLGWWWNEVCVCEDINLGGWKGGGGWKREGWGDGRERGGGTEERGVGGRKRGVGGRKREGWVGGWKREGWGDGRERGGGGTEERGGGTEERGGGIEERGGGWGDGRERGVVTLHMLIRLPIGRGKV